MVASEIKVRVSKKFTIYLPRAVVKATGVREGEVLRVRVEGSRIILEPILDPFDFALNGPKFTKVTFEEFEKESEELQNEIFG